MVGLRVTTDLELSKNCTDLIRGTDCNSTTTIGGWVRIPGEVL